MDKIEAQIRLDVEQYGYSVILLESFAYTIGLQKTFGHPEIIVLWEDASVTHSILHNAAKIIEEGKTLSDGELVDYVLADRLVKILNISNYPFLSSHFTVLHSRFYERQPPIMQILLPDADGKFPDEVDCNSTVRDLQLLDEVIKV